MRATRVYFVIDKYQIAKKGAVWPEGNLSDTHGLRARCQEQENFNRLTTEFPIDAQRVEYWLISRIDICI